MATVLKTVTDDDDAASILIPGLPVDVATEDLPAAFAPLIRNAWYAIAALKDVGRELRGITVLGEPLVMYRTEAGEAVVLDDRCAHRRFSLSKSKLVGDTIQCGYHGFTYEKSGACIWAPTLNTKPRFGVRRYPTAEAGPWLWAWMGDPDRADVADVPFPKLDPEVNWRFVDGYKFNPGNYMMLIENFLDLTHLHFLHGAEISSEKEANNPPRSATMPPNSVGWHKETDDVPSGFFVAMAGGDPNQLVRVNATDGQYGPSLNYGMEERFARPGEENDFYPLRFHIMHAITPQDLANTHQFFQIAITVDPLQSIEWFRDFSRDVVFQQDVEAIDLMQPAIAADTRSGTVEFGIPGDRFGIKMRQVLRRMKEDEADLAR